jgi:hypothetical protein
MEVHQIFTVPIVTDKLDPIAQSDINYIKNLEFIPYKSGNVVISTVEESDCHLLISKDKQILELPALDSLKKSIYKSAYNYWNNILGIDTSVKLKTIHSWVTKHKTGHWNREHMHSNSTFTSCIYLQTFPDSGELIFKKNPHHLNLFPYALEFDYSMTNNINRTEFSVSPENNMIVFFPSHLNHYTTDNKNVSERYVLNIDWWFFGSTRKGNGHGFESEF